MKIKYLNAIGLALGFILIYTLYDKIAFIFIKPPDWWNNYLYFFITLIILPIIAILRFRDPASLMFFYSALLWYLFGLEDVLFFILFGEAIPDKLPWLDSHPFIGAFSKLLGFSGVTSLSLVLSACFATFLIVIVIFIINLVDW